jgi:hypothetical protein
LAGKPKDEEPRRLNRTVGVSEALKGVLDAALKKRGFATRDLIAHWAAMAPKPYDTQAVPDQLKWPRGADHEGATLYLRCAAGQALALSHETPLIAAAVNRYFGYFLIKEVRLSAEPFVAGPAKKPAPPARQEASAATVAAVEAVGNPALKDALLKLGTGMGGNRRP